MCPAPTLQVPDALKSTLPIGEVAGVILLAVFGIRALKVGPLTECWAPVGAANHFFIGNWGSRCVPCAHALGG